MSGKIDTFVDCVSPFSYFAVVYLLKNKEILRAHGVEIEFHPVFLGGINVGSGNKPPWTLPAKGAYAKFDGPRAAKYFGIEGYNVPSFFPILSIMPQRCLIYIKEHFPAEKYEQTFVKIWEILFQKNLDVSKPEVLSQVLAEQKFSEHEIKDIIAAASEPKYKKALTDNTQLALDKGAFGAPYHWVRNSKGQEEPFFGSDRFHYMWEYLGIPFTDITVNPPGSSSTLSKL